MRFFIAILIAAFLLATAPSVLAADLTWSADTTLSLSGVTFTTLTIASGSEATSLTVGSTTFTVTVPSGSTFTVNASSSITFSNNASLRSTCSGTTSSLSITGPQTDLIVTPTDTVCTNPKAIDIQAPQPPREVKITSEEGKVTLTWKDPTESDFANVVILRNAGGTSPISGAPYALVAKGQKKFVDTGVKEGERYQYHVRSQDSTGNIDLNEEKYTIAVVAVKKIAEVTEEKPEVTEEKKVEKKEEEKESAPLPDVEAPVDIVVRKAPTPENILEDTATLLSGKTEDIANAVGKTVTLAVEQSVRTSSKIIAIVKGVTGTQEKVAVGFISYGTATTEKLGTGERAGTLSSYKKAFGKLPATETEWKDALRIAAGETPTQKNVKAEDRARTNFKKVYGRSATAEDSRAIEIAAYGVRPKERSLIAEHAALRSFQRAFDRNPVSAEEWDLVRMIAYSGVR